MRMKLIVLFVLLGVVSSSPFNWLKLKRDYNKHYKSIAEEIKRKQIFLENELVSNSKHYIESSPENMANSRKSMNVPDSLDWRTKGVIAPVKNQGGPRQSDAFAAVEVIETLAAIKTGHLREGSIARVIDCCPEQVDPFQCISKQGGICLAADYPAVTGQCIPDKCKPFFNFDKLMRLKNQNEDVMVTWIQNSTLFVGVDASRTSFETYAGGIYNDTSCSKTAIDHMMQVVGYGKIDSGDLFWILKNTWGTFWGEQGYVRISRGKNTCGIATHVVQVA